MSKIAQRAALRGKMDLGHQISHLPTHLPNEYKNWRKEVPTEVTTRVVTSAKDGNLGHKMLSSTKRGWRSQPEARTSRMWSNADVKSSIVSSKGLILARPGQSEARTFRIR